MKLHHSRIEGACRAEREELSQIHSRFLHRHQKLPHESVQKLHVHTNHYDLRYIKYSSTRL